MSRPSHLPARRRLSREARRVQLIGVAWGIVSEEGTDALSLGRLAERAGVTKPVVYDHFATRQGLLAALYQDFDIRQVALMDAAVVTPGNSLSDRARLIAEAYMACVLAQGREIPGVISALAGSPELEDVKRKGEQAFMRSCRVALRPFAETISPAALRAIVGAAQALSASAAEGEIGAGEAEAELANVIVAAALRG